MHKRDFVRGMAGGSLALLFGPELWERYAAMPASALAGDEKFWNTIRGRYHLTGEYINLVEAGVIDPAMVTRSALQNAASIAKNILTTECIVAEMPDKSAAAAMPDMGGMGGMM